MVNRHGPERNLPAKLAPRRNREPLVRSEVMARIRSKNTLPERRVAAALYALGIRYRRHVVKLPGTPDFANRRHRWAIFVHGCFWHSHKGCKRATKPRIRAEYWLPKLQNNAERDIVNVTRLQNSGFRTLVIWECDIQDLRKVHEVLSVFFEISVRQSLQLKLVTGTIT